MKSANTSHTSELAHPGTGDRRPRSLSLGLFVRVGAILIVAGFALSSLYSASSASITSKPATKDFSVVLPNKPSMRTASLGRTKRVSPPLRESFSKFLQPVLQSGEMLEVFASDCTTPQTAFAVGDTVCVKVSGVPLGSFFPRRLLWECPNSTIPQSSDIATDPQTGSLQIAATFTVGNAVVDSRGRWQVVVRNPFFFYPEATATFTVVDAANPTADLAVASTLGTTTVQAGSPAIFGLQVNNYGPNVSNNVQLTDLVPDNTTFVSFVQTSGPAFTCNNPDSGGSGTSTCTIASLNPGDSATFVATYDVNTGVAAGTEIANTADISSTDSPNPGTADQNSLNNSSTASLAVAAGGGGGTCTLNCPEDINAVANTTEGGQRGAHVTFDAAEPSGTCGVITVTPASGSFFAVGTTVVTVTSETGGGSCSFSITVEDSGTNPPTISCPASQEVNASPQDCFAPVTVGTATASGNNVTIFATRSDGKPMYTCDINGTNCVRRGSDDPFPPGLTTITWIARSHDTPGPYADEDDEIAHRTGAASCTQTITVNDVTPPTITAPPNQAASANASCQFTVPDYTTIATVSDNCACASSDTSEICDSRQPITITQSPLPGTIVGLGPHTITLTANDGSSNNNGAGNTATAQFTLTVSDTTAPAISCPANITNVPTEPGTCSAHVNPGMATATDNCDNNPAIMGVRSDSQPLTDGYPKGMTTITWTATDAAGNHSSCQQTITVIDTEPPTISCASDLIVDFDGAVNGAVVTYTPPVGVDNCPGAVTTQIAGLPSGATFPVGTTTNTFRVTDAAGNTASCSFKVTVALTSIIGLDSVSLSGVGYIDSYDSTGGYPATKGSLANVLSNGTITIAGSAKVFGNVRSTRAGVAMSGTSQVTGNATAGTTVSRTGSATVLGTITNNLLAPVMTLPSVPACGPPYSPNSGISGTYSYNPSTGDLSLTGINIATLGNGTYCFHNVTLSNSAQLKVNGPVTIKITGTLNASGGSFSNMTANPANLRILSSFGGINGVILSNGANAQLMVYAPNTSVTVSGSTPLFGMTVGKTVTISNGGVVHYDTKLKGVWPDIWALIFGP